MKIKSIILATAMLCSSFFQANASLTWGNGNSSTILNELGNAVPTSSDDVAPFQAFDPTVGAFAQLIKILVGSDPYSQTELDLSDPSISASGMSIGNEEVVDTMYSGQYDDLQLAGSFNYRAPNILNGSEFDGIYYVRVFNAAQDSSASFSLGNAAPVPVNASHYWNSSTFTYTHDEFNSSTFDFGGGQTTLLIVPEPGTMALLGVGLVGLAVRRRMNG